MDTRSVWADRFLAACFLQGLASFVGMGYLLYLTAFSSPSPSRIVAGGGAGTWFVMGLLGFGLIGVLGSGLSALFYHYLEVVRGANFTGFRALCAWGHLTVGIVATSVGCLVAAWGGFTAAASVMPTSQGGGGFPAAHAHEVLAPLVVPLVVFMGLGLAGFFAGGLGYFLAWKEVVAKEGGFRTLLGRGPPATAPKGD